MVNYSCKEDGSALAIHSPGISTLLELNTVHLIGTSDLFEWWLKYQPTQPNIIPGAIQHKKANLTRNKKVILENMSKTDTEYYCSFNKIKMRRSNA